MIYISKEDVNIVNNRLCSDECYKFVHSLYDCSDKLKDGYVISVDVASEESIDYTVCAICKDNKGQYVVKDFITPLDNLEEKLRKYTNSNVIKEGEQGWKLN